MNHDQMNLWVKIAGYLLFSFGSACSFILVANLLGSPVTFLLFFKAFGYSLAFICLYIIFVFSFIMIFEE